MLQRYFLKIILVFLSIGLCACFEQDLYTDLTQDEATQMVAVAQTAGLRLEKRSTDGGKTWAVTAPVGKTADAVMILKARGYPRVHHENLGQVFTKQNFVSSPTEERARLIYGLGQELEETIAKIDGIMDARILLAIPEKDPLAKDNTPPSASVFVKYDPVIGLRVSSAEIKSLVSSSVDGMSYDHVTVLFSPSESSYKKIPTYNKSDHKNNNKIFIIIYFVIFVFVCFAFYRFDFIISTFKKNLFFKKKKLLA